MSSTSAGSSPTGIHVSRSTSDFTTLDGPAEIRRIRLSTSTAFPYPRPSIPENITMRELFQSVEELFQSVDALDISLSEKVQTITSDGDLGPEKQIPSPLQVDKLASIPLATLSEKTSPEATQMMTPNPEFDKKNLNGELTRKNSSPSIDSKVPWKSLSDIACTLRRAKYQDRKCRSTQTQLHHLQTSLAPIIRLNEMSHSVRRALAECIKVEDKKGFGNVFNAFNVAAEQCLNKIKAPYQYREPTHCEKVSYPSSFLDLLPPQSSRAVKDLVWKVRYDGDFIAGRLGSLSPQAVSALSGHDFSRSGESIFSFSSGSSRSTHRNAEGLSHRQSKLIQCYKYNSSLQTLIRCVRSTTVPDVVETRRESDVWATVCARLMSGQGPGKKLIPAILDQFIPKSSWPGKQRFELWISQTIQQGAFVTEPPPKRSFHDRTRGLSKTDHDRQVRTERFFNDAVTSLLGLLSGNYRSVIPESVFDICRAIWAKLETDSKTQSDFLDIFVEQWLFRSFVPDILTLPEAYGIMEHCYLSRATREKVLGDTLHKAQDVVWNVVHHRERNLPEAAARSVKLIIYNLRKRMTDKSDHAEACRNLIAIDQQEDLFIVVNSNDIISLIETLYPPRQPVSSSHSAYFTSPGQQSSAPSIVGSLSAQDLTVAEPSGYTTPLANSYGRRSPLIYESNDIENVGFTDNNPFVFDIDKEQLGVAFRIVEDMTFFGPDTHWAPLTISSDNKYICTSKESLEALLDNRNPAEMDDDAVEDHVDAIRDLLSNPGSTDMNDTAGQDSSACHAQFSHIFRQLVSGFERQISDAQMNCNYVVAHGWSKRLYRLRELETRANFSDMMKTILMAVERPPIEDLKNSDAISKICDVWSRWTETSIYISDDQLNNTIHGLDFLRDKMYFVADIRKSAPYGEVETITTALHTMGKRSNMRQTHRLPLPHRPAASSIKYKFKLNMESHNLEMLSAPIDHGGPNKLSDDHSLSLKEWMDSNMICNICCGEERIHKLCQEIRICMDSLASGEEIRKVETDILFQRRGLPADKSNQSLPAPPLSTNGSSIKRYNSWDRRGLQRNAVRSHDSFISSSQPLSNTSSRENMDGYWSGPSRTSSMSICSPEMTEDVSPSRAPSIEAGTLAHNSVLDAHHQTYNLAVSPPGIIGMFRRRTVSFLLSELNVKLFGQGSETDIAFWTGVGGDVSEQYLRETYPHLNRRFDSPLEASSRAHEYDYHTDFKKMFQSFSAASDPVTKLLILHDIDKLLPDYMEDYQAASKSSPFQTQHNVPRLDSVDDGHTAGLLSLNVEGFRNLFINSDVRPATIFRDLQYIASLTPSHVLKISPEGKSFWNAHMAILGIKQELITNMVNVASNITDQRSSKNQVRSAAQLCHDANVQTPSGIQPPTAALVRFSHADAALLNTIAAREGDGKAQYHLALMHLIEPDLVDYTISPLACPEDVFQEAREKIPNNNQHPNPEINSNHWYVALHWLNLASANGYELARQQRIQLLEGAGF